MTAHGRAVLTLVVGAVLISFSPVFVKLAVSGPLGPTAVGFWRVLVGALLLFTLAVIQKRRLWLSPGAIRFSFLAGFFFFIDLYVWHRSIIYAGAGIATILANTQVFATTLIGFFAFKERVTVRFLIAASTAFAGVIMLVGVGSGEIEFSGDYARGVLFGLATGLAYACNLIFIKKGRVDRSRPDLVVFMAWFSLSSAVFLGLTSAFEEAPVIPRDLKTISSLVGLGLIVHTFGWVTISSRLTHVTIAQAGLILLMQPTLAMVWGVLFFGEYLTVMQIAGAAITLAAMYAGSTRQQDNSKKERRPESDRLPQ